MANPIITMIPPNNCVQTNDSPKIKKAKIAAPTGSNNIAIEITFVLTHLIAKLNRE